jgi:TIR domain
MKWDVFISHASEDKADVARPLTDLLEKAGLRVWLDENELRLGDSLRAKIDQGLAQSSFGVVIVSRAFLEKDWPTRELDGLVALETRDRKVVLPVWHQVAQEDVARYSPTLASKLAVPTAKGIDLVAKKILDDVFYHRGSGVFDAFHPSDREWFTEILEIFNRPAFRGKYHGYTGQEGYQKVMRGITKALNTGVVEDSEGAVWKTIRSINCIKDSRLNATMLEIVDVIKRIDNLIATHSPYPGAFPNVVTEINELRDGIITKLNSVWEAFRIHTLPIPSQVTTTMSLYDSKGGPA